MTSSSRRFALKAVFAVGLAAAFAGCDKPTGLPEFAAARAAYEVRDLKKAEKLLEKSLSYNRTSAGRQSLLFRQCSVLPLILRSAPGSPLRVSGS